MIADEDVLSLIQRYAEEHHGASDARQRMGMDNELADFGLDSEDLVCLAAQMEDEFGIEIDPVTFLRPGKLADILKRLRQDGLLG